MHGQAWRELSVYQSHDLVRKKFADKHERHLSAAGSREIVSFFSQGREYFEAAATAGMLVKPLLLYYGVNALTRGLLLFLSRGRRAATLKPSHGISAIAWQNTLSAGASAVPLLEIKFESSGTFAELAALTKNREYASINTPLGPKQTLIATRGAVAIPEGAATTLRDLFGRIPRLGDLYEETFDELSSAWRADVFAHPQRRTFVSIFGSFRRMPPSERLRNELKLPPETQLTVEQSHPVTGEVNVTFSLNHASNDDRSAELPLIADGEGRENYVLAPLPSGLSLSLLSLAYALSYCLGMLARYHPVQWLDLIGRSSGDLAYPLAREAVLEIESHFPDRLVTELILWHGAA